MRPLLKLVLFLGSLVLLIQSASGQDQSVIHQGEIFRLQWHPSSRIVALQGVGGTWIYNVVTQSETYFEEQNFRELGGGGMPSDEYSLAWGRGIAWNADGTLLATPNYSPEHLVMAIKIREIAEHSTINEYLVRFDNTAIDWNGEENLIATSFRGPWQGGVQEWHINLYQFDASDKFGLSVSFGEVPILDIDWKPEALHIAIAQADGTISIQDFTDLQESYLHPEQFRISFFIHNDAVNCVVWHPSDNVIATGGDDSKIHIWESDTGKIISTFNLQEGHVNALDWNSDGTLLSSAGEDGIIRIWDVAIGEVIATFEGHEDTIIDLDWSPDDQLIATASLDDTVRVWEVELPTNSQ